MITVDRNSWSTAIHESFYLPIQLTVEPTDSRDPEFKIEINDVVHLEDLFRSSESHEKKDYCYANDENQSRP